MRLGLITGSDLDDALESVKRLGEPMASRTLADALNHTANQARLALQAEMPSVFDRPTPWAINSVRVINATERAPEAAVYVKDKGTAGKGAGADEYLLPHVEGGARRLKRSEGMLREIGILPAGMYIAPGSGARLDAYGNISRGHMMQILSGLRAFSRAGSDHNATGSARSRAKGHAQAFYVIRRGKTAIGIGERRGEQTRIVLAFVREPSYRARFDFYGIVRRFAENDALLEANIDTAITKALAGTR